MGSFLWTASAAYVHKSQVSAASQDWTVTMPGVFGGTLGGGLPLAGGSVVGSGGAATGAFVGSGVSTGVGSVGCFGVVGGLVGSFS